MTVECGLPFVVLKLSCELAEYSSLGDVKAKIPSLPPPA